MKPTKNYCFAPDYTIPPGETLKELMECLEMSPKDLSKHTGLTFHSVQRLITGDLPLTCEIANMLERVTHVHANLWNNLEVNYREQLVRIEGDK